MKTIEVAKITDRQRDLILWHCQNLYINMEDKVVHKNVVELWTKDRKSSLDDLNCFEAESVIKDLEKMQRKAQENKNMKATQDELSMWKNRCMAAVGGYLRMTGRPENAKYIIAIIEQSQGFTTKFGDMTKAQLITVYQTFCNKERLKIMKFEDIKHLAENN